MISQEARVAFKERKKAKTKTKKKKSGFGEEDGSRENLGKFHKKQNFWTCWRMEQFEQKSFAGRK